jgi:hypothetical protein
MLCYNRLHKYKYRTKELEVFDVGIEGETAVSKKLGLTPDGMLIICQRYSWDGPSGPTIDTATFMRASLVHDALYQLMREGELEYKYRIVADKLLREMCLEDGMWGFRAWYVYWAVRIFSIVHALPGIYEPDDTICVEKGKYV